MSSSFTSYKCLQCIKLITNVVLVPNQLPCRQGELGGEESVIINSRLLGFEGDRTDHSEISFQYSLATQRELFVFVCIAQQ